MIKKKSMSALGRLSIEAYRQAEKLPLVVVLDNVRSLHNVGSVFRTSDAFRIEKLYLTGITARPPHREIQKTALGATESVDWSYEKEIKLLVENLKSDGYLICALEQAGGSVQIDDFQWDGKQKLVLVVGNEVDGISDEILPLIDTCLEIPQFGTKHSFNVSVACGIALWELYRKSTWQKES